MASEASKIRNQCAKKYGVRERAYKDRIAALEEELSVKNAILDDYESMKRAYMKILVYSGLTEAERQKLLRSQELDALVDKYAGFLGIAGSSELLKIARRVLIEKDGASLQEILAETERRWLK